MVSEERTGNEFHVTHEIKNFLWATTILLETTTRGTMREERGENRYPPPLNDPDNNNSRCLRRWGISEQNAATH